MISEEAEMLWSGTQQINNGIKFSHLRAALNVAYLTTKRRLWLLSQTNDTRYRQVGLSVEWRSLAPMCYRDEHGPGGPRAAIGLRDNKQIVWPSLQLTVISIGQ